MGLPARIAGNANDSLYFEARLRRYPGIGGKRAHEVRILGTDGFTHRIPDLMARITPI